MTNIDVKRDWQREGPLYVPHYRKQSPFERYRRRWQAAPAFIQVAEGTGTSNPVNATFTTQNDTAGNGIVVVILYVSNGDIAGVTDSEGNTYGHDVAQIGGSSLFATIFSTWGIVGGTKATVHVAKGSTTNKAMVFIHEVSGCLTSSAFDKSASRADIVSNSATCGTTAALSQASEIAIGGIISDNATSASWTTGTAAGADNTNHAWSGWLVVSSTAAVTMAATLGGSGSTYTSICATYKALSASSVPDLLFPVYGPSSAI